VIDIQAFDGLMSFIEAARRKSGGFFLLPAPGMASHEGRFGITMSHPFKSEIPCSKSTPSPQIACLNCCG
jgi:hypothetical protein